MSNELPISVEFLEDLLRHRSETHMRVEFGLDPDAQIIGASFDRLKHAVILIYDREVPEIPILRELP